LMSLTSLVALQPPIVKLFFLLDKVKNNL